MDRKTRVGPAGFVLIIAACAGDGSSFSEIEQAVTGSCGRCHDVAGFERLIDEILALDPAVFDELRFPDEMFSAGLVRQTTADLIASANPERDATIDPSTPARQAWILHQMHILDEQLRADPASDFTAEASFERYNAAGMPPLGCTTISRVGDLAEFDHPSQMPPLWTAPLFAALGQTFVELTPADRDAILTTVESRLSGGRAACF